jgi:integrase
MQYLNDRELEPGTVNNYLRGIRALFNRCKLHFNNDDLQIIRIQHDPFSRVKIPAYRRKKRNVTLDVLKKIRDAKCSTKREELARDYFMMQFYLMGINASDLYFLNPPENGRVEYKRIKTDTEANHNGFILSIRIEPELQELIEKYSKVEFLSEIKAFSTNRSLLSVLNKGLKKLCKNLKLPNVSTNWSRHTWASLARNKAGISKDDIDFCLGHVSSDHAMADIYIEIDYSICDVANRKVLDLLK